MAKSEARRQKQLAKKKAKRDDKRTHLVRLNSDDPTIRLANAERWPIVQAAVSDQIWKQGIGQVVLARRCPDDSVAFSNFLIDAWCLGVKDAYWRISHESEFHSFLHKVEKMGGGSMQSVTPEHLAKLVYASVDYAQSYGFPPHPDYPHARMLLAGIDATQCQDIFEFGKDGKPFYFQGPNDSPAKVRSILQRLGHGEGHYVISAKGRMNSIQILDDEEFGEGRFALEE